MPGPPSRSDRPGKARWLGVRLRLDLGLLVSAAGGLVLLYLMFKGWFNLQSAAPIADDAVGVGMGRSFDAWISFDWIDLYLLLTVAVTLALPVLAAKRVRVPVPTVGRTRIPVEAGTVLMALGVGAFILIGFRLLFPPWDGAGREAAPFLALLCTAVIVAGGRLSSHLVAVDRRRRTAAAKGKRPGPTSPRPGR